MKESIFNILCAAAFFLLFLADQVIKHLIRLAPEGAVLWRLYPLFEINPCSNRGAAFSLLSGSPQVILLLSLVLIAAILYAAFRLMHLSRLGRISVAILLAGAFGNLADRLLFGCVTDYIRVLFIRFPVFNLADILITLSVVALILLLMTDKLETNVNASENQHGTNH